MEWSKTVLILAAYGVLLRSGKVKNAAATAIVTVLELAPPIVSITGTALPVGAFAGTCTFTWHASSRYRADPNRYGPNNMQCRQSSDHKCGRGQQPTP